MGQGGGRHGVHHMRLPGRPGGSGLRVGAVAWEAILLRLPTAAAGQIDVASTWRDVVPSTYVMATATNEVGAAEQSTQTGSLGEKGVQTDDPGAPTPRGAARAAAANITEFMKK